MVLLARDERELARLDEEDEHEVVLAASPLDAATLVEDELLLTLPFVPRCERAECARAARGGSVAGPKRMRRRRRSPSLAALKSDAREEGREVANR